MGAPGIKVVRVVAEPRDRSRVTCGGRVCRLLPAHSSRALVDKPPTATDVRVNSMVVAACDPSVRSRHRVASDQVWVVAVCPHLGTSGHVVFSMKESCCARPLSPVLASPGPRLPAHQIVNAGSPRFSLRHGCHLPWRTVTHPGWHPCQLWPQVGQAAQCY